MATPREEVLAETSRKLADGAAILAGSEAVVGLDGFVDEIIAVVDKRFADGRYDPVRTIAAFGDKVRAAAGESSNYELVVKQAKLGGNGPIMANALARLGFGVTYVGNLGYPEVHPVFRDFAAGSRVLSIAEPGHTDALEFDDGKIMLGKLEPLEQVNWENLMERVGRDRLGRMLRGATLIGMVNWTMLPGMTRIWERLLEDVLPGIARLPGRLFIDLADPEKRTPEDLKAALGLLSRFQQHLDVILGLNLKESMQVEAVLNLPSRAEPEATVDRAASAIRERLGIDCVVIHPKARRGGGHGRGGRDLPRPVRQAAEDQHRGRRPLQRRLLPRPNPRIDPGRKPLRRGRHQRLLREVGREPDPRGPRPVRRRIALAGGVSEECPRATGLGFVEALGRLLSRSKPPEPAEPRGQPGPDQGAEGRDGGITAVARIQLDEGDRQDRTDRRAGHGPRQHPDAQTQDSSGDRSSDQELFDREHFHGRGADRPAADGQDGGAEGRSDQEGCETTPHGRPPL